MTTTLHCDQAIFLRVSHYLLVSSPLVGHAAERQYVPDPVNRAWLHQPGGCRWPRHSSEVGMRPHSCLVGSSLMDGGHPVGARHEVRRQTCRLTWLRLACGAVRAAGDDRVQFSRFLGHRPRADPRTGQTGGPCD